MEAQWRGRSTFQEVMMSRGWQYCPSEGLDGFIRFSLGFSPPTSERKSLTVQVGTHPSAAWQVGKLRHEGRKFLAWCHLTNCCLSSKEKNTSM